MALFKTRAKLVLGLLFAVSIIILPCKGQTTSTSSIELKNPILPGYFADPSLIEHEGKYYLYATADPWGADFLSCWVTSDFQHWQFQKLNWPTKPACTSPNSNENKVWAPSVIKKGNTYFMYVSVGSEVWCGTAPHPLGPWKNMLGDKPMISYDQSRYYHVIDAEAFQDDDGKTYLYWGSGWDWKNGHCFAAELNEDMSSFKNNPVEVTPSHYFEGPFMTKHQGKYYLTYSDGKTIEDTYQVHYAVGDSPYGPFKEASNSPILTTDSTLNVYGPGHHSLFTLNNKNYILYHRHRLPFISGTAYRQLCLNEVTFNDKLQINKVVPSPSQIFPSLQNGTLPDILAISAEASSQNDRYSAARNILDGDFSTRWEPADQDSLPTLQLTLPSSRIQTLDIRFEYPWKRYFFLVEYSTNGKSWKTIADYRLNGADGSPVSLPLKTKGGYLRFIFKPKDNVKPSIWDIFFN